ncbi:MAG: leucyl/phenylalanyl-tRNA--protein transferase [Kiritimatiellaceae bacterium]|nr:leucyl/phenylalanyl-tRNA--protein transferase [Kiritimatiellaceae bacterium]
MEPHTRKIIRCLRRIGFRHHIYNTQVRIQSLVFPPPPIGHFPPLCLTTRKPPYGLLAKGGELTAETLLLAYSKGIFPLYNEGAPVEWHSCHPRMVLFLEKMRQTGLRPIIKSGRYSISFDADFEGVVKGCSDRRSTWLFPSRRKVSYQLHQMGHAHSVEVRNSEGELVGGLFGVDLGKMFLMESGFYRESNASKVAVAYLNCHLQHWGYRLNDIGSYQETCQRMGYEEIPRKQYLALLPELVTSEKNIGKWQVDERLDVGNWIPAQPGSQLK